MTGRCCADNWSAAGVWLRCQRAWSPWRPGHWPGERDVTLVTGSSLTRRTGTTRTLLGTVLLHITSVKPDLTQIARLVEFQKPVINKSRGYLLKDSTCGQKNLPFCDLSSSLLLSQYQSSLYDRQQILHIYCLLTDIALPPNRWQWDRIK